MNTLSPTLMMEAAVDSGLENIREPGVFNVETVGMQALERAYEVYHEGGNVGEAMNRWFQLQNVSS